jgi:hypothetical protein
MALEIWEHEHSILFLNKVTKDMEIKASGLYTDIWDEDDKMVPPLTLGSWQNSYGSNGS